jgi:pimeloyl-ACP methyl ester carboxylesterase
MRRVLLLALAAGLLTPAAAHAATVSWEPCPAGVMGARCGHVAVPLDRLNPAAGLLHVGFELYPHTDTSQPALGTMLDIEGGPGFATRASRSSYLQLDAPLLDRRNLLLIDARGTGSSGVLECRAFSRLITHYRERAGACAAELGPSVDLYDTHAFVDDIHDVLDALAIPVVDVYGDSYGSYAAQAFAVRYPSRLRSLVLDGTYPLPGTDPAYGDLAEATQRAFRLVCARRPSCAARGVDPVDELTRFLDQIRAHPSSGVGTDPDGQRQHVRVDDESLTEMGQLGYVNFSIYRDLLAATRSWDDGDRVPLLRLIAENVGGSRAGPQRAFSEALYLAVTCHDYPQMWDPAAPLDVRQQQFQAFQASLSASAYAPFSPVTYTSISYEGAAACLRWPGPARPDPPAPPDASYPGVPTLVLNGDLDTITAASGARVVASRFPNSTFVETHNMIHISALGDRDSCGAPLVRRFVATLDAGDTGCAAHIEEVRVVDAFPRIAADAAAATPADGDHSRLLQRQVAAVAAATVADAVERWQINYSGHDRGLRGGTFSYRGDDPVVFRFDGARWTSDVAVSGVAHWDPLHGPLSAALRVTGPGGLRERLVVRWDVQAELAQATLDGSADGAPLHATMLAP